MNATCNRLSLDSVLFSYECNLVHEQAGGVAFQFSVTAHEVPPKGKLTHAKQQTETQKVSERPWRKPTAVGSSLVRRVHEGIGKSKRKEGHNVVPFFSPEALATPPLRNNTISRKLHRRTVASDLRRLIPSLPPRIDWNPAPTRYVCATYLLRPKRPLPSALLLLPVPGNHGEVKAYEYDITRSLIAYYSY